MRIAVCIKQVPASNQIEIDPNTHQMVRTNAEMTMNPADMNALTEAINIRDKIGGSIDIFTMGNESAKSALITAIAIGANEGFLVTDRAFAGGDSLGTAKVLAKALEKQGQYDLIMCGALSSDGATGQVGPMIAELLHIPSITDVKKIVDLDEKKMEVYKAWKGKYLHMSVGLPAVITISLGSNTPKLPTLRNQMKAKKKELYEITNKELNLQEEEIGLIGAKSVVTDTIFLEESGKKSTFLEGSAEEQTKQLIELIKKVGE